MSDDEDLWSLEDAFWLGGVEHYQRVLAAEAVMVFPRPAGLLDRAAVIRGIEAATRWERVSMTDRRQARSGRTAVLAYAASAERTGEPAYRALCSSTYVEQGGEWRLLAHQQTPVLDGPGA